MVRRVGRLGSVLGTLIVLLTLAVVPTARAVGDGSSPDPVRVLLVGDSVTNGSSGDWTWRYRLWQHLQAVGAGVDLVGPRDTVSDADNIFQQNLDYIDPDFDRDHAARGGMRFEVPDVPVEQLVEEFHPDVVVELLGVNDLVFGDATPQRLITRVHAFVAEARAADPGLRIVLGHVPQRFFSSFEEYNHLLDEAAAELDTPESPVEVASFGSGFRDPEDLYDLAHPNAAGEVLVASGVADALARLGVGESYPRPLPTVPLGPRLVPTLTASAGDEQVDLSWSAWRGSNRQLVWQRDLTTDGEWREVTPPVPNATYVIAGLANGHTYEFRLRPVKGYWPAELDIHSNVVRATPRPPGVSSAPTASADRLGRATVTWTEVEGASGYRVEARRSGATAVARSVTSAGPSAVLTRLAAGRRYDVVVRAVRDGVASDTSPAATLTVPAPRAVRVTSRTSPAVDRVRVAWRVLPEAASYVVEVRPVRACRAVPVAGWTRAGVTRRAVLGFTTRARTAWVRVVATRDGARGAVTVHSSRCGRVS